MTQLSNVPMQPNPSAVDENGHAFMNNYPKSYLYIGQITGIGAHLVPLDKPDIRSWFIGADYDTSNWQQSAIDRE